MRLQLKLGRIATESKDGTHLLRADVCQAATSIRAQARFTITGEKWAFPGHAVPCPEVDVSGRLEGSHLSNSCWCLLTTEEARRDRPKDGQGRGAKRGWHHPACPRGTDSSGEQGNHRSRARLQDARLQTSNITPQQCLSAHQ